MLHLIAYDPRCTNTSRLSVHVRATSHHKDSATASAEISIRACDVSLRTCHGRPRTAARRSHGAGGTHQYVDVRVRGGTYSYRSTYPSIEGEETTHTRSCSSSSHTAPVPHELPTLTSCHARCHAIASQSVLSLRTNAQPNRAAFVSEFESKHTNANPHTCTGARQKLQRRDGDRRHLAVNSCRASDREPRGRQGSTVAQYDVTIDRVRTSYVVRSPKASCTRKSCQEPLTGRQLVSVRSSRLKRVATVRAARRPCRPRERRQRARARPSCTYLVTTKARSNHEPTVHADA